MSPTPTQDEIDASNLFIAASDGSLPLVQYFLSNGSKVTDQDDLGYSVFHAAASYNHMDLMRYLLPLLGPNPLPFDADGDTPLHVTETVEMAQLLITHTPALPFTANQDGVLPIEAADEEGLTALVAWLKETYNTDYVTLAQREQEVDGAWGGHGISEEELQYVLQAADLHEGEAGSEGVLNIDMGKLQELVQSGKLDGILAHQRAAQELEREEAEEKAKEDQENQESK